MFRYLSLIVLLTVAPLAPHETPSVNAVVSAAGVVEDVAPGGIATVWGLDFSSEPGSASSLPLPIVIHETSVTINGIDCPLFYVSEFQINLQIPFETPTDIEVDVIVTHEGLANDPFNLIVREDAISIFTYERVPASGVFEPVVLHSDGVTLVTPENPARANEVVVIYATGFGPLMNAPLIGMPALTAVLPNSIYSTSQAGYGLSVQYSGLAAGFVGLWQPNIRMPDALTVGEAPLLRVTLDNSFQRISFPFEP